MWEQGEEKPFVRGFRKRLGGAGWFLWTISRVVWVSRGCVCLAEGQRG